MSKYLVFLVMAAGLSLTAGGSLAQAVSSPTLDAVEAKGFVQCGIADGVPGFSARDANNNWAGLDVDFCRAVAAAIFNDANAVRYTSLANQEWFTGLIKRDVDILSRTTTWTMSRDTQNGISFIGTTFYTGQGFMVRKAEGITSVKELGGSTICIEAGTTTELNVADYFSTNAIEFKPLIFANQDEVVKAYEDGTCKAFTSDSSALAAHRSRFAVPADHTILPEIISKEPLGPAVRAGDTGWFNIARWTYFAMLEAEDLGVTQANVDEMLGSDNPAVKRLLGVEGDFGTPLGLTKDWAYQIVKHIGNYGESYDRHLGPNTPIGLERGLNALWKDGGIQYAPPIR